jgi:hypothetical protein
VGPKNQSRFRFKLTSATNDAIEYNTSRPHPSPAGLFTPLEFREKWEAGCPSGRLNGWSRYRDPREDVSEYANKSRRQACDQAVQRVDLGGRFANRRLTPFVQEILELAAVLAS